MKKHVLVVVAITTLLFGCASTKYGRADLAKRAKVELVGKSKEYILMCAGVPMRSQQHENMEFMTYYSGGDSDAYGAGTASSAGAGAVSVKKRYCEVTFVLRDGVVEKVNYAGRTGGLITEGEQCAFVLENCLPE